jgi:ubiquinone/menaquinone biosynthesis C-methylase UbiE
MSPNPSYAGPQLRTDEFTTLLFGHAAFQYLFAGCSLGLFPLLNAEPDLSKEAILARLGLQQHPGRCLLFGLSALRLIIKDSDKYRNGDVIRGFFERDEWKMLYDTVLFEGKIVYPGQTDFVDSLASNSNVGLRNIPGEGSDLYRRLAQNEPLKEIFYNYMSSWSQFAIPLLLHGCDLSGVRQALDVGGGDATNAIAIARAYLEMRICVLDLNAGVGRSRVASQGLADRIEVKRSDMFVDEFPRNNDCVFFIHQLVIWPLDVSTRLLRRAHEALKPGGIVVIFSSISDDTEDGPAMSALDSAYFVSVPASGGMIYAWKDYDKCLQDAGFVNVIRKRCVSWTPHGIVTAQKPS